jgi:molecular chaperone GrpE (heat shock protein)
LTRATTKQSAWKKVDGDQEFVCEELQGGYRIGEDVIRHAMVRVKG